MEYSNPRPSLPPPPTKQFHSHLYDVHKHVFSFTPGTYMTSQAGIFIHTYIMYMTSQAGILIHTYMTSQADILIHT